MNKMTSSSTEATFFFGDDCEFGVNELDGAVSVNFAPEGYHTRGLSLFFYDAEHIDRVVAALTEAKQILAKANEAKKAEVL